MHAPGGAAFDMPPRRRRGRTRILSPVPVLNETARPRVNAATIRAGPESGRNRVTAFAGGLTVMSVGVWSGFPRLTPAGRGGGAWGGKDEPGEDGGRTDPDTAPGGIPTNP